MSPRELNLIPPPRLQRLARRRRARRWARSSLVVLAALVLARVQLETQLRSSARGLSEARARAQEEARIAALVEAVEGERDELARALLARQASMAPESALRVFQALDECMPPDVALHAVELAPAPAAGVPGAPAARAWRLRVEGVAPSTGQVAAFLSQLAARPDMRATELEYSRLSAGGAAGPGDFALATFYLPGEAAP